MNPDTASVIREIFLMLAAGVFTALCLVLIVVIVKLYRPLRETAHNSAKTTENLSVITGNLAGVSEETANNIAQASGNAVTITANLKEGSEEIPSVIRSAGETAKSASEAAGTVATVAENVKGLTSLGLTGGSPAPVTSLLRLVRGMLGNNRRGGDGGAQQET